jgi:hypothetical protein
MNSNISLGDFAVYSGCVSIFGSYILYEHFMASNMYIYCRLPYELDLNQISIFGYERRQVIPSFKYYLDNT